MQILSKIALATITVSMASFASAASISGSTDFRITLPEILVLYHWDDAHLILEDLDTTIANDSDDREISDITTRELSATLQQTNLTFQNSDVNTTSPIANFDSTNTVTVTLENSWAVRSLSSGDVSLTLENTNNVLKNVIQNSTSTIVTNGAVLLSADDNVTDSGNTAIKITSGWTPVKGDIQFKLDLTNANNSGEYNTRGGAGKATVTDEATDTFLLTLAGTL